MKQSWKYIGNALSQNAVPIVFTVLCILSIQISGQPLSYVATETISRITRNSVLVFSLIIPVLCGMGLNFGIVLGAIAAQVGLTMITHWSIDGMAGIAVAWVIATVLAGILGYFVGKLFNKVKGQEMITGMILGFAAIGVYDIICIYMLGSVIPMRNPELMLQTVSPEGQLTYVGLRNTVELHKATKGAIDKIWKVPFQKFLPGLIVVCLLAAACLIAYGCLKKKQPVKDSVRKAGGLLAVAVIAGILQILMKLFPSVAQVFFIVQVPVVTMLLIGVIAFLVTFLFKTKLGQDIRTAVSYTHLTLPTILLV